MLVYPMVLNSWYAMCDAACERAGYPEWTNWSSMLRTPKERAPYEMLQAHTEHELFRLAPGCRAVHVAFTDREGKAQAELWRRINLHAPNPWFEWSPSQIEATFGRSAAVARCFEFPRDYLVHPMLVPILGEVVHTHGGEQRTGTSLRKIHLAPRGHQQTRVRDASDDASGDASGDASNPASGAPSADGSRGARLGVVGVTVEDGGVATYLPASELFCSLGTTTHYRYEPIEPNTWQSVREHAERTAKHHVTSLLKWGSPCRADADTLSPSDSAQLHATTSNAPRPEASWPDAPRPDAPQPDMPLRYSLTAVGVARHALNWVLSLFDGDDPNKLTIPASGASITTMLSVTTEDGALVAHCDRMLSMAIGTTNSHWVLLGRRVVTDARGDQRVVYALRGTAGGRFPTYKADAGFLVNNLCNQSRLFGATIGDALRDGRAR